MCDIFLIDIDSQFIVLVSHDVSIIEEILGNQSAREGNVSTFERGACQTFIADFASQFTNRKYWVTIFSDICC